MLQALLKGKVEQWFTKPPWDIEDLLTSVVFGSADYAGIDGWKKIVMPFIGGAVLSPSDRDLLREKLPTEIKEVKYYFWPTFANFQHKYVEKDSSKRAVNFFNVAASEPDLIIKLTDSSGRVFLILVEVKLLSSKNCATSEKPRDITDQLAKYWLHLLEQSRKEKAIPLALVYIKPGLGYPHDEIQDSKKILGRVGEVSPKIYYQSWYSLPIVASESKHLPNPIPRILEDVVQLFKVKWGMYYEPPKDWEVLGKPDYCSKWSIDLLEAMPKLTTNINQECSWPKKITLPESNSSLLFQKQSFELREWSI